MAGLLALTALCVVGVAGAPAAQARGVPRGFMGTTANGPLLGAPAGYRAPQLDRELAIMAASGVEIVRTPIEWAQAQPSPPPVASRSLPVVGYQSVGGVRTDFSGIDRLVGLAARHGLRVMPIILKAPRWARQYPNVEWSPPASTGPYARFCAALVRRYGRGGTFWRGRRQVLPIRSWVIWNEPEDKYFWSDAQGRPAGLPRYVQLLKAAHGAIKGADRHARVVLAGLASSFKTSWVFLDDIYKLHARRYFDVVAIHPFTARVSNVVETLRLARGVMNKWKDGRKPLMATEVAWASARARSGRLRTRNHYGIETSERVQALRLGQVFRALADARRRLGLESVYWYTWMTLDRDTVDPFDYSGLRQLRHAGRVRAKPAFRAFVRTARRLEGCAKTTTARCR